MNLFRTIMPLALALAVLGPAVSSADRTEDRKRELQRIQREMERKKRDLRRAKSREQSVLTELESIDKAIQSRGTELTSEQRRLRDAESALSLIERDASVTEAEIARLQDAYGERLRALYKMGRSGYAVGVFTSSSMSDAVKREKYLEMIAARDREVITAYRKALDELGQRQADARDRKEEISRRRRTITSRQEDLEQERRKKEALLSSVRKEKGLYEQVLEELEESSDSLWKQIRREEEEKRREEERRRAAAARAAQTPSAAKPAAPAPASAVTTAGRGRLPWPLNGRVVTRFGRQKHQQFGTVVFRQGIEIEAREGDPVRAVTGGRAAFAGWYKGYGKLLILDHGGGIYSLYGYLSRLDVAKNDTVAARQVIGLAGDTGSPQGSRLYFEVRRGGEAEDPLAWLAPRQTGQR